MWSSYTIVCPPLCVLLLSPTRPCFSLSSIHHRNIDHPPWYPISARSVIPVHHRDIVHQHIELTYMVLEGFPYALNDILCFTQISPQFLYFIFPYNSNAWKRKLERQLLIHTYSFTASAAVTLPISLSYFNEQHENWFNLNIPDTIK